MQIDFEFTRSLQLVSVVRVYLTLFPLFNQGVSVAFIRKCTNLSIHILIGTLF